MFDQFFKSYKSALSEQRGDSSALEIPLINKILVGTVGITLSGYLCTLGLTILTAVNLSFISTAFLLLLLIAGILSILEINRQMKNEEGGDVSSRKMEIDLLIQLCNQDVFALNGSSGLEWLILECSERLDNSTVGVHNGSTASRLFDRLLYPIIAFGLGQITNQLLFLNTIGNVTIIVITIILLVLLIIMVFPLTVDLMNRDKIVLAQMLEDLRYIQGSRYIAELTSRNTEVIQENNS